MSAAPKNAKWYDVPAGTRESQCRGQTCRATVFWTVNPATDKKVPVDCDVDGGFEPSDRDPGRGVTHFATCPDVAQFSGASRGGRS